MTAAPTSAHRVADGAAASSTVTDGGSRYGACARAQPTAMAATAAAAVQRASAARHVHSSHRVMAPNTNDGMTPTSPGPFTRWSNNSGASAASTGRVATATAPDSTPATRPRVRNHVRRSGSSRRWASAMVKMAARYAPVTTAITPTMIPVGFHQALTASPSALPSGTYPPAMPPTTVPRKNGVMMDATPNATALGHSNHVPRASGRNAYDEPRRMMPNAARNSGTYMVLITDAKASGNDVHMTTSVKMSHTWLASHTGPIDECSSARMRSARRPRPAMRSHAPVPKSAPPSTAYSVRPATSRIAANTARARFIAPSR